MPAPCARTVLVIEDETDTREALCELLEDLGYPARGFAEGQAALEHLAGAAGDCCLILLDLMIPFGVNGWQFRAVQQKDPALTTIPVIIVSAVANVAAQAAELGVAGYLPKPTPMASLLAALERHCPRTS